MGSSHFIWQKIQQENQNLPLMVHIGSAPPHLSEILDGLDRGMS